MKRTVMLLIALPSVLALLIGSHAFAQPAQRSPAAILDGPARAPDQAPSQAATPWSESWPDWTPGHELLPTPAPQGMAAQAASQDEFGYTWDDSEPFEWIPGAVGTDSGIRTGQSLAGPFEIGFPFKYYHDTHSEVYLSEFGLLGFNPDIDLNIGGKLPSPGAPNGLVALYWGTLSMDAESRVYYRRGGTAPNRFFLVQWHRMHDRSPDNLFTFQAILWESGDIVFQYHTMRYTQSGYSCASAGIEDSLGSDGLQYWSCGMMPGQKAIRFHRPPASPRAKIWPRYQGRFIHAGETIDFRVPIYNAGDMGTDTFELAVDSAWPASLWAEDGLIPVSDSDGDGSVDTGPVAPGASAAIVVRIRAPADVGVGAVASATLTARSSLNGSITKQGTLQSAVSTSFAQIYRSNADDAMSLYLAHPRVDKLAHATSGSHYGYDMAVSETPSHDLVYAWVIGHWAGEGIYAGEIEYAMLDSQGNSIRPATKLTRFDDPSMSTYDCSPAVAVAPDGRIGVLWYRYLRAESELRSYNIYFAILSPAGDLIHGPVNLTNNTQFGPWGDPDIPRFSTPQIAPTANNRFVLAWQHERGGDPDDVAEVWYAIVNSQGSTIRAPGQLAHQGQSFLHSANPIPGQGVMLTYQRDFDIYYTLVDSGGAIIKAEANLTSNGQARWSSDAIVLSDGRVAVAWTCYDGTIHDQNQIAFAILDSSLNPIAGPTGLVNRAALSGNNYVSLAADAERRAIVTWMDDHWQTRGSLYYALINSAGEVLTPPMIFISGRDADPMVITSLTGYGNSSYQGIPPATSTPTSTPIPTATATATVTPTPTSTPMAPWLTWRKPMLLLRLLPGGESVWVDYGNIPVPSVLTATLEGPALFGDETQALSIPVDAPDGSQALDLKPESGAVWGSRFTLRVGLGDLALEREGVLVSGEVTLPMYLK